MATLANRWLPTTVSLTRNSGPSGTPACPDQNNASCFLCPVDGDDEDEDEDGDDDEDEDNDGSGGHGQPELEGAPNASQSKVRYGLRTN